MKRVLLWLWQFPQNIAGWILSRKCLDCISWQTNDRETVYVYFTSNVFGAGVSLGSYILLDASYRVMLMKNLNLFEKTVNHEHGHQKQSRYLGFLYLIVIGLPSATGNLIDRLFHKKWSNKASETWYYNQPWEKWADKLGEVER